MANNPFTRAAEATRGLFRSFQRAREINEHIGDEPEQLNPLQGQRTNVRPVTNGDVLKLGFGIPISRDRNMGRLEQVERRIVFGERQLPDGHRYVVEDGVPLPAGFGEDASTQLVGRDPFADENDGASVQSVGGESFVDDHDELLHAKPVAAREFLFDEFRNENDDVNVHSPGREPFVDENDGASVQSVGGESSVDDHDELLHAEPVVAEDFFSNEFHDNRTVARGLDPFADENEVPKNAPRGLSAEQKERARLLVPGLIQARQGADHVKGNENDDLAH
jgi:hypothetical protein